ncbi:MAG: type II toxin-antitoxin system prevent-host-death family antitoxin [Rhizobiaceae bacterium]|nr:type II toxin-antitoxin system prevent-host-death family antitoxin [Rhizobiaceae bacterium]
MSRTVSSAEANREFSRLLREVREGRSFVITSHGRPVARIEPIVDDQDKRRTARDALVARLRSQPALNLGKWSRDEAYDD